MKTKKLYMDNHPKSYLTQALRVANWPDDQEIMLGGGLIAPYTKCSNLYKLLQRAHSTEYVVGGKVGPRASQGSHFAVKVNPGPNARE